MSAAVRAPGRPRSATVDQAILVAALDEYGERGYDGFCLENVATRAGVAKATIYRRHPSKLDLVMAAVDAFATGGNPLPDTGSLHGDLLSRARGLRTLATSEHGAVIRRMSAEHAQYPELDRAHRKFIASRRTDGRTIVRRAVARGEIRGDIDCDLIVDLCVGPVFYRAIVTSEPISDAYLRRLIDAVVRIAS